jgi:hypothetical protein
LQLFPPPPGTHTVSLRFLLLRKQGEPLLLIPDDARLADAALSLYPAQTRRARLARLLVALSIYARLPALTAPLSLTLDLQSPFLRFLDPSAAPDHPPRFAMLFGNPRAAGRRFVLLVFNDQGRPEKIIKAGSDPVAAELIRREADFLKSVAGTLTGAPRVLGDFVSAPAQAVALEYIGGPTPRAEDSVPAGRLLASWLDRERTVDITALPAWQRLRRNAGADPLFHRLEKSLAGVRAHPAVCHGDFAPWNIRVNPATRQWVALDWERGEYPGVPAWDWFHFVIQPALLVARRPASGIADVVEQFLQSPEFAGYAAAAGIQNCARPLLLGYLLHCRDALKPSEGMETTNALLELLRQRWSPI